MTDAIGPSSPPPEQPAVPTTNVPLLAKQMQNQVLALAETLQQILDDPSMCDQPSYLQKVAENGHQLQQSVEQAFKLR